MRIRTFSCPSCGAPLPAEARVRPVTCAYCRNSVLVDVTAVAAADFKSARAQLEREPPPGLPGGERVTIAGANYVVIGHIACGESTDVYLAYRARRVTERVVAKVVRAAGDADLLVREWEALLGRWCGCGGECSRSSDGRIAAAGFTARFFLSTSSFTHVSTEFFWSDGRVPLGSNRAMGCPS